jgi:glutaminyl-tRNA synthetase
MAETDAFEVELPNHGEKPELGSRKVPFSRELWIEREDFQEEPPRKWFRLAPGAEVRLRGAALVTCQEVVKDGAGAVIELRCTWDPASRGGNAPDGRKVKGTIHWVSAVHALDAEVRLYDHLFLADDPMDLPEGQDWHQGVNPCSLAAVTAKVEPALVEAIPGERFQFERTGYFSVDPDAQPGIPVFNRTVGLKDSWSKIAAQT